MIDALTTNKTSFFRENQHFEYMRTRILPELKKHGSKLRLWSAGCSSGEEPYTISMLVQEEWSQMSPIDVRILATDISASILAKARAGEYEKENLKDVPPTFLSKYFSLVRSSPSRVYSVTEPIRKTIRFAQLNLMDSWPMKGPFEVIFCRNVMIYFDCATQGRLVQRFYDLLVPGGHLLVGHSESLVANSCGFKYVQPATYVK
jgi:chemotaxis protein methyltransferase CheR